MLRTTTVTLTAASATPDTDTEGDPLGPTDEIQTLSITGDYGTYTVTYDGDTTDPLPATATAAELEDALLTAAGLSAGDITVTGTPAEFTLTYGGALAATDVPEITTSATLLRNPQRVAVGENVNHLVHLRTTSAGTYVGGTPEACDTPLSNTDPHPFTLELRPGEELYARGSGTLYVLEAGV